RHRRGIALLTVLPIFLLAATLLVITATSGLKCYRLMRFHALKKKACSIQSPVALSVMPSSLKVAHNHRCSCLLNFADASQALMHYCVTAALATLTRHNRRDDHDDVRQHSRE